MYVLSYFLSLSNLPGGIDDPMFGGAFSVYSSINQALPLNVTHLPSIFC